MRDKIGTEKSKFALSGPGSRCYIIRVETPPLDSAQARDHEDVLREQIVSLAAACPHTKNNPLNCPLHEVRKLEPNAIIDWVDGLNPDSLEYLTMYHQCCLVIQRESGKIGKKRRTPRPT